MLELDHLTPTEGAQLLLTLDARGDQSEQEAINRRLDGHPLALQTLEPGHSDYVEPEGFPMPMGVTRGVEIDEEVLAHLSPALFERINPYGRFHFDVDAGLGRTGLRRLRNPEQVA